MKFILLFVIILCATSNLKAQTEFSKMSKSFPALYNKPKFKTAPIIAKPETKLPFSNANIFDNEKPLYTPNTDFSQKKVATLPQIGQKEEISLTPKQNDFVNPGDEVVKKLNKKGGDEVSKNFKLIRGNQDLGIFTSKAKIATIRFRDFGEIDGDKIRIYLNDKIIVEEVELGSEYKTIQIDLKKGFNKIDFEALNQGEVGPNTADFKVTDDLGNLISSDLWNLATGFKASITIIKN